MNKIWKMGFCGDEWFVDEQGMRRFYFDLMTKDLCGCECSAIDSVDWLDGTRDLDSQLDFIKFAKYGDIKDIINNMVKYENAYVEELTTYKSMLRFYIDYLNGNLTNYSLYDKEHYGVPHEYLIKNMLDNLNDIAIKNHMSEFEILDTWFKTDAYEIEDFEETFILLFKNVMGTFVCDLEDIYIALHGKIEKEKLDNIEEIAYFLDMLSKKMNK